jgi:hypothetical protein
MCAFVGVRFFAFLWADLPLIVMRVIEEEDAENAEAVHEEEDHGVHHAPIGKQQHFVMYQTNRKMRGLRTPESIDRIRILKFKHHRFAPQTCTLRRSDIRCVGVCVVVVGKCIYHATLH